MKLKYQKPAVAVEHFELSQSIAACTIKIGFADNKCVRNDPDVPAEMRSIAFNYPIYFSTGCDDVAGGLDVITHDVPGVPKTDLCFHTQTNATFTS